MTQQTLTPIKRALISVSDKTGLIEFCKTLNACGVEIISTGGTANALQQADIPVVTVSSIIQFPEIMEGRVKTLHPLIHGGILGKRDQHQTEAASHHIQWIDLVVCNLYPFAETIKKQSTSLSDAIENIDVGGPTMIRAAAKNFPWVTVLCDPNDYETIANELTDQQGISYQTRKTLSAKAFGHTAQYDTMITHYLNDDPFPEMLQLTFKRNQLLRYGENPHQKAAVYEKINATTGSVFNAKQHQGKQLSYNNLLDGNAAWRCVQSFEEPTCVVIKHTHPCGAASANTITTAFERAFKADQKSAFGGIIALNEPCNEDIAEMLSDVFIEMILAPQFTQKALEILKNKPNVRLLEIDLPTTTAIQYTGQLFSQGCLLQEMDQHVLSATELKIATQIQPMMSDLPDLLFAWQIAKHVKSNAIVIAKNKTTVGIGGGQVSRIDAIEIALHKAGEHAQGAVLASDAFFPFRDSIDRIAQYGIAAIIQPGGSIRDEEVIAACDEHDIAMIFTGIRGFNH